MRLFLFSLFLFCLITTRAVASTLPEPVVAALRHAHIPLSAVSIVVQQTGAPDPLVSVNADRAVNPASTMKLLTTIASLETLGPAYRWKTEAYLDGKLENGVLQGDLVFKGYGDPKLTVEEFWMWLHELRQRGLREIRGDIVLDHSFFEAVKQDPAAFDHDPTRAYNVGTDALLLNFNAMHLHLIPDGHATRAMLEPDLDGYTVVNRITTSRRLRCGGAAAYKAHLEGHDIILEGRMPADCGEADEYFSLLPQDQYFFAVFSALWKELGGTVQGQLRVGNAPAGQVPFAMYVSPPLAEVIRDINKFSNNTMARQLFLTLGMADQVSANRDGLLSAGEKDGSGEYPMPLALGADSLQARQEGGDITDPDDAISSAPATLQQDDGDNNPAASAVSMSAMSMTKDKLSSGTSDTGPLAAPGAGVGLAEAPAANIARSIAAIQQWLATQHMQFPELVMENGAGLSRNARISARHIADLLQRVMSSPFHAELEASLPILGMDGTVKKRFRDSDIAGYAHLKTGTLDGVKSIAGYVRAHDGKQWIVVFIVNNRHAALAEPAQNALIEWLQKDVPDEIDPAGSGKT
ncbi:MAG: D-alanyl-D-alanine carboxypeptidase/D-alanyl-D-alanine-endopeptidase [Gallionella sp.]